jgi:regulator of sigma E protease
MDLVRPFLETPFYILLVILGLGLIIFLHELGHFVMAKKNKVRVEVFSLGFGPAIWRGRWGETEYRLSWFPLGGYVKMAGETLMEERRGEPWELTSKSPWQRFQIFVAGAVMNLLIAFPIGIFAYTVGMYEHTNRVGTPGLAETRAGLRPGDVILEVDGREIQSLDKFRIEMIRRQTGTKARVKVRRGEETLDLEVVTERSAHHQTDPTTTLIKEVAPDSSLEKLGVRQWDEIVSIDGQEVVSDVEAARILRASHGKTVELGLVRRKPAFDDEFLKVSVPIRPRTFYQVPDDDWVKECVVGGVRPGYPAYRFLEPNDVIVQVGDREIRCWQDLKDVVEPAVNRELAFQVRRDGNLVRFTLRPTYGQAGKGAIGITPKMTSVFAVVREDSYFHRAGLRSGDRLKWVDGISGDLLLVPQEKIPGVLGRRSEEKQTFEIRVEREGEPGLVRILLELAPVEEGDLREAGLVALSQSRPLRKRPFGSAVAAGLYEPLDVGVMTFEILGKLVTGREDPKGLSGPIGIIHASYKFVELSFGNFVWLMCLITVNLGIFNLLPIPVLDGGHNVLLLIEVVRKWLGRPPPSERFVLRFQTAGLIFIAALFLFVTFNDITRFFR